MTDRGWSPTSMPRRETQHSYGYPELRSTGEAQSALAQGADLVNARRETADQAAISVRLEDAE